MVAVQQIQLRDRAAPARHNGDTEEYGASSPSPPSAHHASAQQPQHPPGLRVDGELGPGCFGVRRFFQLGSDGIPSLDGLRRRCGSRLTAQNWFSDAWRCRHHAQYARDVTCGLPGRPAPPNPTTETSSPLGTCFIVRSVPSMHTAVTSRAARVRGAAVPQLPPFFRRASSRVSQCH